MVLIWIFKIWRFVALATRFSLTLYQTTKFCDMTKLKAFADKKLDVAKMTISLFDSLENTVGKRENAGYQHLLFVLQCFQKPSSFGSSKVGLVC